MKNITKKQEKLPKEVQVRHVVMATVNTVKILMTNVHIEN